MDKMVETMGANSWMRGAPALSNMEFMAWLQFQTHETWSYLEDDQQYLL